MIVMSKSVQKFIAKQSKPIQAEIDQAFMVYPHGNVKKLKKYPSETRIRVGKYRIICEVGNTGDVKAVMAGVRGDIYKHARSRRKRIEKMRRKLEEMHELFG